MRLTFLKIILASIFNGLSYGNFKIICFFNCRKTKLVLYSKKMLIIKQETFVLLGQKCEQSILSENLPTVFTGKHDRTVSPDAEFKVV